MICTDITLLLTAIANLFGSLANLVRAARRLP